MNTLEALRRGDLAGTREVRLSGLHEFPPELLGLSDTLEVLDIGGGVLTALPDDFSRLRKLKILFCSGNRFECLPPVLGDCPALSQIGCRGAGVRDVPAESLPPSLRWLILTDNSVETLPRMLGECPSLQKLMLAGNRLTNLPESLANAERLELIRLSCNRFEALPPWLARLPSLAWVSWGANPVEPPTTEPGTRHVMWRDLDVGAVLGEGTSGRVHEAVWRAGGEERRVALKVFKGAMTSDGLPEREIATCLAAGEHPHLTAALGQVVDHPEGTDALLMPLLPKHWRVLARPPSLSTCSRDVYAPDLRFASATAMQIAHGIASAAAHLHARGLLHGDLYAHNILWDGATGDAALSDFGAACVLPADGQREAWCRVEVRAWGLLLAELLDRCPDDPSTKRLRDLANDCVQPDVDARPSMAEAMRILAGDPMKRAANTIGASLDAAMQGKTADNVVKLRDAG